jgi:hypothetical protein
MAKRHTLSYHTIPRNRRMKLTAEHDAAGGEIVGAYPAAELAEMRLQEMAKRAASCS